MNQTFRRWVRRLKSRAKAVDGQALVEYALILALIAVVVVAALSKIGTTANTLFNNVAGNL